MCMFIVQAIASVLYDTTYIIIIDTRISYTYIIYTTEKMVFALFCFLN